MLTFRLPQKKQKVVIDTAATKGISVSELMREIVNENLKAENNE